MKFVLSVLGAALLLAGCNGPSRETMLKGLESTPVNDILAKPELHRDADAVGKAVFEANCAGCHGADLKGLEDKHTPDLTDGKWLYWGDDLERYRMHPADIEKTILYGIRSGDPKSRNLAVMPAKGEDANLTPAEIDQTAEYILQLSGRPFDAAKAKLGRRVFADKGECWDCHLPDGTGDGALGSADLTQPAAWLYGSDRAAIVRTLTEGRQGVCPAFHDKLTAGEIKAAAIYVHDAAAGLDF